MTSNDSLNILFVTTEYGTGGAGIAAERAVNGLREQGHTVQIESLRQTTRGKHFLFKRRVCAKLNRIFEYKFLERIGIKHRTYLALHRLPFNALGRLKYRNYDVIHFHWINYGFVSSRQVQKISKKVTTVWTLHSYWPFSMPYQYASLQGSESYRDKYFATLYSNICKSHIESLKSSKVKWVVPSPHMIKNLGLRDGRVASIPNPLPRVENLKMKKPEYYLFIGAGDVFDPRKGLQDLLVNWIECYDQEKPRKLKIVGPIWPHSQPTMLVEMSRNYGVEYFGHVSDFQIMQLLFSKSFAIFVPSLDETFGQVILEALANQTKVIARRDLSSLAAFQNYEDGIYELDFKLEALGTILDSIETEEILDKSFSSKVKIEFAATTIAGKLVNFYRI